MIGVLYQGRNPAKSQRMASKSALLIFVFVPVLSPRGLFNCVLKFSAGTR